MAGMGYIAFGTTFTFYREYSVIAPSDEMLHVKGREGIAVSQMVLLNNGKIGKSN